MIIKNANSEIVTLTKFRDDTYIWTSIPIVYGPMRYNEALAKGYWQFGIKLDEIKVGLNAIKYNEHDVVIFKNGLYTDSYKINYGEMP